ncbi:terminase [Borreliella bissettiae]|uniref:terminase n=1 Tax=Borrelia bissettiae TaxID=64897 RepID=UPI001E4CC5C3|nr:terminase [Borreliella bissettiae]MCD2401677.1 terminase [Borreliella bissettiae]
MQEQVNEEAVTISESLPKNDKELVTISSEEYERLVSDAKKLPDMISREDFEKRLAEAESNFIKARKQAERQAEANAFKDSKILSNLEKACEQYEITPPFANVLSVKDAKLAFLDAMKKKYNIKFKIDEEGDLDSQIDNISLLVQELTAYKQMVNARNRFTGQIINETKLQKYKDRFTLGRA